jgi:hypothetical protein
VDIGFQRSRWSTRERVDFCVHAFARHEPTAEAFAAANQVSRAMGKEHEQAPAGDWNGSYPQMRDGSQYWTGLRAHDDVTRIGEELIEGLRAWLLPEIDRQLNLPLTGPTPPEERLPAPSREQRDQAMLKAVVTMMDQAGVELDIQADLLEE